jgi:hypothetical protein
MKSAKELANTIINYFTSRSIAVEYQEGVVLGDSEYAYAIVPEFSYEELLDMGIDAFDFGDQQGAWWDWYSAGTIVVGEE